MKKHLYSPLLFSKGRNKTFYSLMILLCALVFPLFSFSQISTFTSVDAGGNWETVATWTSLGSDVDGIPDSDDIVIVTRSIVGGPTVVTINSAAACNILAIGNSANDVNLDIAVGFSLAIGGDLQFNGTGGTQNFNVSTATATVAGSVTYVGSAGTPDVTVTSGSITISGAFSLIDGTWLINSGGSMTFNGLVTQTAGIISNTTTAGTINFNAGYTHTAGTFTSMAAETINFGGNFTNSAAGLSPFNPTSNSVFNGGTPTVTPTSEIIFGNIQFNAGINVTFSAGDISVAGNWSNLGGTFTPGANTVTFNGTGTQTITKATGETFYNLTTNTTGPLTLGSNVTVDNLLTMTAGDYNLGVYTLTLGTAAAPTFGVSTLTRTAGIMYNSAGGSFKRYWPAVAVSNGGGNFYGLFPIGTSTQYRPVTITSTTTGTAGYLSASHTDATTATDVSVTGNPGTVTRITDQQSILTNSGIGGAGVYDLDVKFTSLIGGGALSDLRLVTPTGATVTGTHQVATGTIADPVGHRATAGLNITDLANTWAIGTVNTATTPLRTVYYSIANGNWSSPATWSTVGCGGAAAATIPSSLNNVQICSGTTVTVDGVYVCNNLTIGSTDGGTLQVTAGANSLTVNAGLSLADVAGGTDAIMNAGPGSISVAGAVTLASVGVNSIRVSTGTITFTSAVTLANSASQDITYSGTGTINFNGGLTDNGAAVITTVAGCTANFGNSYANSNAAMVWNATSNVVFTGSATLTPSSLITFGNFQINAIPTVTLAGDISVAGNWNNLGGTFTPGANTVTFNGTGTQTITKATGETFYNLTTNTTGPLTLGSNVTVDNLLTMTAGNYNLGVYTLTLGTAAAPTFGVSTLTRTAGIMYNSAGGSFKRYWPAVAVSNGGGNFYGLFPIGTSTQYRPVTITSTTTGTAGYLSASHTDATTATDVSITGNPGTVTRITDQQSILTNSGIGGAGVYDLDVTFTSLIGGGALSDLRLVTPAGATATGTHQVATGTIANPVGRRATTGLNITDLANTWAIGTVNTAATPLRTIYYSIANGNWSSPATWSTVGCGGAAAATIPSSLNNVQICSGNTVTIDGVYVCNNLTIGSTDGGTLQVTAAANSLTVNGGLSLADVAGGTDAIMNAGSGSIAVTGAVTLASVGVNSIRVSTGTITFTSAVTLANSASQDITYSGTGTINFNGGLTDNGAAVITTVAGCIANFGNSYANSNAAMVWNATSNVVFTGSATLTPSSLITFGNFQINATPTLTLAGNISVAGNWSNFGGTFTPSTNTVTFNGTGTQTITKATGETFYNLTTNTTGPLTLGSNVTVDNLLTMTAGNYNLGAYTLTLGTPAAPTFGVSTLTRTAGIMYNSAGGSFKRYWPAVAVSNGGGNFYGLFPIGTSTQYRPVTITSTTTGTAGYLSASHTDATTATDVSITGNPGTVTRITDQQSILTNSGIGGAGVYDLDVTFTSLLGGGALSDLRLVTPAGATVTGTHQVATGTIANPVGRRATTGLNITDLANTWAIGTVNTAATPLRTVYYSIANGNWSSPATWSTVSCGGAVAATIPNSLTDVQICSGTTVTVDGVYTCKFLTIGSTDGGTLQITSAANSLTVNGNLSLADGGGGVDAVMNAGPGTIAVTGAISLTTVGQNSILLSTGTITFTSLVTLANDVDQDITYSGTGTINFNGGLTDNGAAIITTVAGCTANFGNSYANSNTAMVWNATSNVVFTGSATLTPSALITFGNFQINATPTLTLAGNISVAGNWSNLGGTFTPGTNTVTFNGTGTQTITKASGETFYNLTTNTTGPLTLGSNVTVTNTLNMTAGNYNLVTYTLTLGSVAASTLTRTAGIMYNSAGGSFKRYWPAVAVSNGGGNFYGLFPIGTSTQYRPVTITSTTTGTAGYLSASHTDATTATDVSITGNPGTVTRITDQQSILTNSGIGGAGVYDLDVTFTSLLGGGALSDLRLVTPTGATATGTHQVATGTITDPVGHRATAGLSIADLANTWVIGTVNTTTTPLRPSFYSIANGNWSSPSTWSIIGCGGAAATSIPSSLNDVQICSGTTVTVDGVYACKNLIIGSTDGGTLQLTAATSSFTINGSLSLGDVAGGTDAIINAGPGSIAVTGAVSLTTVGQNSILVSSGTITFTSLVTLANDVDQDITYSGTGTINFNGGLTDNGLGIITTVAGCTANFGNSYANSNVAMVWPATSNVVFTGSGTLTPASLITFGNFQINTGATVTLAGNIQVAGDWTNNGGTLSGGTNTVTFESIGNSIGGTSTTTFPNIMLGSTLNDVSLTINVNTTCANLTFDADNSSRTLTHGTTNPSLTVSGNVTLNQPTANAKTTLWDVSGGSATVAGNLVFAGTNNTVTRIGKINVSSGSFSLAGTVTWMTGQAAPQEVTTEVISVSTGTLTFANSLTMSQGAGTLQVTGSGVISFNGVAAPSYSLNGTVAGNTINSVFTTSSGSTINFAAGFTNANTAVTIADGSTSLFTGTGIITPTSSITFGSIQINAAPTITLAGSISLTNNWTNLGGTFTPGTNTVTFNGTGTQTITKTTGETFYALTSNTTGPLTLAATTDVMITNTLTMTAGNYNLNGKTLTLGNSAAATLVRTAGVMYSGIFKRWFPTAAISSTVAPLYGLFPMGTSTDYRPVAINSSANPTTAGYVSASHTDALTVTDVSYVDNEGATILRIADMKSLLTVGTLAGGTYTIDVTFTTLSATGVLTDLKLETYTGSTMGSVGASALTSGSVTSPTVKRTGLTAANLQNDWVIGTINTNAVTGTPLRQYYYSRKNGNWNDVTVGAGTWSYTSGGAGPSCDCIPVTDGYAVISVGQTVTVNVASTVDFVQISNTATLDGTFALTVNKDLTTSGSGKFTPTGGIWTITRNLTMVGTGSSSLSAASTVTGILNIGAGTILTMNGGVGLTVTGNLVVDGTLALSTSTLTLNGISGTAISGSLGLATISGATATIDVTTANKTISSGSNLTIGTTFSITGAITVTNNGTITLTGNLTGSIAGSTWTNAANSTLNATGAVLTATAGTILNASASPNTINYNGGGAQTIKTPATSYYNLTCSNAGTKSLAANTTVTNLVTIQGAAILDETVTPYDLSGAGGLTMTGTSQLLVYEGANSTSPELTGTYSLTAGSVTLTYTGGTGTIRGATFYNLTLAGSRSFTTSALTTVTNAFIYSSSGNTTLGSSVSVGSWTQSITTGNLNDGGFTITVNGGPLGTGGWTKDDASGTLSGTAIFSGSGAQTIGGTLPTTFNNLTINNTSATGVTISQPTTVSTALTLTDGYVYTDAINLLILNDNATSSIGSAASFVNGPMKKIGDDAFVFPVGKTGATNIWARLEMVSDASFLNFGVTTEFTCRYYDAASANNNNPLFMGTGLNHTSGVEYWDLARTLDVGNNAQCNVRLYWENATRSDILSNADLRVAHLSGTTAKWENHGGTGVGAATGSILSTTPLLNFSPVTFGSAGGNNPLPVELLSFDATKNGNIVDVKWITATETNNDYFNVERSSDGINFQAIAVVKGSGTNSKKTTYTAVDSSPLNGISYYRLKQTDYDGKFTYSQIVAIEFSSTNVSFIVFPNPVQPGVSTSMAFNMDETKSVLVVLNDINGKEVYSKVSILEKGNGQVVAIDASNTLPAGVYIISATSDNTIYRQKLIIR